MAFKFPFTNYHELNLTWVLDQLKKLFEESAENVSVIENYDGRLTAVETELPTVSENAAEAARSASAAATLAQTAKATADTAQENAIQAQGLAGQARQEAQAAKRAADAATQAAEQAQATAQNFDGRITQAENDASQALEASRSFENRVQAAITAANNANQTATNAQGIATRADQKATLALDTLNSQRSELERIGAEQAALITEETESGKTEIENLAQSVLDSIPADYTALSALVDKKAPVIINSASGSIASFDDGADNMKIQKLVVNIEPIQAGSGDPSPTNKRPISGRTGDEVPHTGVNIWDEEWEIGSINESTGINVSATDRIRSKNYISALPNTKYYFAHPYSAKVYYYDASKNFVAISPAWAGQGVITTPNNCRYLRFVTAGAYGTTYNNDISINFPATYTEYHAYTGNQISVTFPETIYGGEDEIISRKLKKTMDIVIFDGTQLTEFSFAANPSGSTNNRIAWNPYANIGKVNSIVFISDTLKNLGAFSSSPGEWEVCCSRGNARCFIGVPSTITSVTDWNAYLEEHPITLVYELAEPVEYTLTPQEMKTFYGVNNIWADAGPVSVDYPADTKLYIDGKLAELQATILENI